MNEENLANKTVAKKLNIFVVDDDTFLLDIYTQKFSKSGYGVEVCDNGEEALKKFRSGTVPDVVLLDVIMPGLTGLETLETIRKENLIPNTTIIMLTNQDMPDDVARANKCHVDGYIVKAMAIPSEVLSEVEKITSAKQKQNKF